VSQITRVDRLLLISNGLLVSLCIALAFSFAAETLTCIGLGLMSSAVGVGFITTFLHIMLRQDIYGVGRPPNPFQNYSKLMREIEEAALEQGMDVLVEVHNEVEMERATRLKSKLIGINNRDLKTFTTNLANTERLAALAPRDVLLVSESGINTHADCQRLSKADVRTFLVGESLMRQKDLKVATQRLLKG